MHVGCDLDHLHPGRLAIVQILLSKSRLLTPTAHDASGPSRVPHWAGQSLHTGLSDFLRFCCVCPKVGHLGKLHETDPIFDQFPRRQAPGSVLPYDRIVDAIKLSIFRCLPGKIQQARYCSLHPRSGFKVGDSGCQFTVLGISLSLSSVQLLKVPKLISPMFCSHALRALQVQYRGIARAKYRALVNCWQPP